MLMEINQKDSQILKANKKFFERDAKDFDVIFDDPGSIKNWLTRIATKYYCKDHIKIRLQAIVGLIDGGMKGQRVCELGCGPGRYPLYYHQLGAKVVGVDYSPEMLNLAIENREKAGVSPDECSFIECDVLGFDNSEKFDVVIASGLIDYLPNHLGAKLVERMSHLVKENGLVIITFPFKGGLFNTLRKWLRKTQGVYTYYYDSNDIDEFFNKNNLVISRQQEIVGYWIVAGKKTTK